MNKNKQYKHVEGSISVIYKMNKNKQYITVSSFKLFDNKLRKHFPLLSSFVTYHWVCN